MAASICAGVWAEREGAAMAMATARARNVAIPFCIWLMRLPPQMEVEVEPRRELDSVVVHGEAVAEVLPAAPLELEAGHDDVLDRVVEEVGESVVPSLERVGLLPAAVVDVQVRVPDRGGEPIAPAEVVEPDDPKDGEGLAGERPARVAGVGLDAYVHRRVVHVVLDALAVHDRGPDRAVHRRLDVGAEIHAPARLVAAEVDGVVDRVRPGHVPIDRRQLDVAPLVAE